MGQQQSNPFARSARIVVVLDLMLPGFDGLEVRRRLRQFSDAYVLMLTARTEEVDRIVGLAIRADDYLAKPFSPRELMARGKAMLRRPRGAPAPSGTHELDCAAARPLPVDLRVEQLEDRLHPAVHSACRSVETKHARQQCQ